MAKQVPVLDLSGLEHDVAVLKVCAARQVCSGVPVVGECGERSGADLCVVPYHYPLTLEEVADVAERAGIAEQLDALAMSEVSAASAGAGTEVQRKTFRPKGDLALPVGLALLGLGVFWFRQAKKKKR